MFFKVRGIKRIVLAGASLLIMGSVAGCGASSAETAAEIVEHTLNVSTGQQKTDYEVKKQYPYIYVNQVGYKPESDKSVVFRAKQLPSEYEIRDLDTGETVYTGEIIKSVYDSETDRYSAIGRFNDFEEEGQYYIYADLIGESYSFSISEEVYDETFLDACRKYFMNRCGIAIAQHGACHTAAARLQESSDTTLDVTGGWHMDEKADRDSLIGSRIIENLLLAYEMNPGAFGDEEGITESGNEIPDVLDEVKYGAEWLLKMQDERTGGVYAAALTEGATEFFSAPVVVANVSMDATINFAASMARFGYIYQKYDPEFATKALRAADRAWECFLNNQKELDNSACFKAAAQLYRATGNAKYNSVLEKYFALEDFTDRFDMEDDILLGAVTYLSTSQAVDKKQCDILIKALMQKSEAIARRSTENSFMVSASTEDGFGSLFSDMRCLTITNHIIYNHEYTTIIENHLHYLMGMNPEGINFVTEDTENTFLDEGKAGIMNDPQSDALMIFMMSVLQQ